ncbi:DNA helicase UvrD [Candidatus Woesearchaeota archaeon]|nr:DNA helicase UvrD [Candidatus Woesearchaeota archaeon]
MRYIGDFHLHSRFAQASSKKITFPSLEKWARKKGLDVLGTGDAAHPVWNKEVKEQLKDEHGIGIYRSKTGFPFVLEMEISLIYTHLGKGRRVHHVILFPSSAVLDQVIEYLLKHGRLDYDGRPIFNITSEQLVADLRSISQDIEVIPAHIWTPWFAMFGSKSGYDSLQDCFGNQSQHIHAIETGISSDPQMNWRVPELDEKNIISFSDSHSFWPWRLGREATMFELPELTYKNLLRGIRTGKGLAGTVETEPAYGRYHWDGHRNCNFSCGPEESKRLQGICPVCKKPLTIGVDYRVEELAKRPATYKRKGAPPYWKLMPLHELIAAVTGKGLATKDTWTTYNRLLAECKDENTVLLETPAHELARVVDEDLVKTIIANREQRIDVIPGYDGEYGKLKLDWVDQGRIAESSKKNEEVKQAQKGLRDYFS